MWERNVGGRVSWAKASSYKTGSWGRLAKDDRTINGCEPCCEKRSWREEEPEYILEGVGLWNGQNHLWSLQGCTDNTQTTIKNVISTAYLGSRGTCRKPLSPLQKTGLELVTSGEWGCGKEVGRTVAFHYKPLCP